MTAKAAIRYLGYRMLDDGGRGFDFCVGPLDDEANRISIQVSTDLFQGPDRIFIQEAAGICYETLRYRLETFATAPDHTIRLNSIDVAQHRKSTTKPAGRRY